MSDSELLLFSLLILMEEQKNDDTANAPSKHV